MVVKVLTSLKKINTAGVIPVIFASSILLLPNTMSGFGAGSSSDIFLFISSYLGRGQPLYLGLFAAMIIFFGFFILVLFLILMNKLRILENMEDLFLVLDLERIHRNI